jgi:putative ABC transport system ATP-binding protein
MLDVLSRGLGEDRAHGQSGAWAPRAPAVGVRDLDGLVRRTRAAGLDVHLAVEGEARAVPTGVDLAAFRIVQEALTNVIRHAGGDARAVEATKIYGSDETAVIALDEVTVDLPTGRFTAIMGPSGSGKSTLVHCLAGLDRLSEGQVFVGDVELGALSDKQLTLLRRTRIGFVFQAFNLVPTLTAGENIALPLTLAGRAPDPGWFDEVIATVGLGDRLGHRPAELSGGQQQRVAVARALISRPAIVFADEPTGNLDSRGGAELLGFLRRTVDEMGQTVVMVTHDPVAAAHADAVVFVGDGRVVDRMADPTAERVLEMIKRLGS